MLSMDGVSKTFTHRARPSQIDGDPPALDRVDLDVEQGEFLSIVGPSGCGKTTLLRCIAGFETPERGTVTLAGREVVAGGRSLVPASERGVGFVPQDGALFPHLTVAANVGFGLRNLSRTQRRHRTHEVLELVGLAGLASRRPHQLSGGQQQRVALARAIAPSPQVILLDEPFSALDAYLRVTLRAEVRQILSSLRATVILVTHDQDEALSLGDRVAAMRRGRVVQTSTPREMYSRPDDVELAQFLGTVNVVDGDVDAPDAQESTVTCAFGTLPVDMASAGIEQLGHQERCRVLIRPEQIHVASCDSPTGIEGTLLKVSFHGHDSLLSIDVPRLNTRVAARILGDSGLQAGDRVTLSVDDRVCVYPPAVAELYEPAS